MRKPTNFDYSKVLDWVYHHRSFWAWERMDELLREDAHRAWRMVQVMIAYAPDSGTLGYVAAGPVENLMGGEFIPLMREEAENSPRFRIALGMTNGLAKELEPFAERTADFEELPPVQPISVTAEEIALMVAYFHNGDTCWAASLFSQLKHHNAAEAFFMLQMLLDKAEKNPELLNDVFVHAVDPFIAINFSGYKSDLTAIAMRNEALRQYFIDTKYPRTNDSEGWADMIRDLSAK
jgi:hypothetical protein